MEFPRPIVRVEKAISCGSGRTDLGNCSERPSQNLGFAVIDVLKRRGGISVSTGDPEHQCGSSSANFVSSFKVCLESWVHLLSMIENRMQRRDSTSANLLSFLVYSLFDP